MRKNNNSQEIEKALSDNVKGMVQLDEYHGTKIPLDDWDIITPLDDIIMAEYCDTEDGETIKRGGIHVPNALVEHSWRACKALLCGPTVRNVKQGDYFLAPNDKGLPSISKNADGSKKLLLFINEPRIFCIVKI